MPLGTRVLKVTISLPSGDIVLDQSINLHVKIHKDALAIQNSCDIDVVNLSQSLRQSLLSQFTAWNKRNVETGQPGYTASYINVTVAAGWANTASSNAAGSTNASQPTIVFSGQIVQVDPLGAPPNLGVTIKCYSQQINKLAFKTGFAPTNTTFANYVAWAGAQMGVSRVICETSYNDTPISNPFAATHTVGELLIDIQNAYRPNVAAYIDNNVLIVHDINKIISTAQIVTVDEFIGTPMWTEWGVTFTTLFNPQIALAGAATLKSVMNPSLNKTFVISSLDYDLTSRDRNFYGKAFANPSA